MLTHRHHLTVHGIGGPEARLAYAAGLGPVASGNLIGLEGEGRLGYVFTRDPQTRIRGIFGAQVRLTSSFGGLSTPATMPASIQFGAFIGFTLAPVGPRPEPNGMPRHGLGLLAGGGTLLTGAAVLLVSNALFVSFDRAQEAGSHSDMGFLVITLPVAAGMAVVSAPLLAVGGARYRRYRAWRDARLAVRGAGLTIAF